jgi:hypothetical protein
MPTVSKVPITLTTAFLAVALATAGLTQPIRTARVEPAAFTGGTVTTGEIRGDESAEYIVAAKAGQILSVDLLSSNASANFNVLPAGLQEALFVGSTSGTVADLSVPETGDYVVQVFVMRGAPGRDRTQFAGARARRRRLRRRAGRRAGLVGGRGPRGRQRA